MTTEELEAGAIEGVTQSLGPTMLIRIEGLPEEEDGEAAEVEILMLERLAIDTCWRHCSELAPEYSVAPQCRGSSSYFELRAAGFRVWGLAPLSNSWIKGII